MPYFWGTQCIKGVRILLILSETTRLSHRFKIRTYRRVGSERITVYELYSSDSIENTRDVSLSRGGLLLIALLSQGDYSNGLHSCGLSTSTALARCGFGDRLLAAITRLEGSNLDHELESVVLDIQAELCSNSQGFLSSCNPTLALALKVDHFSLQRRAPYFNPLVTSSTSPTPQWLQREPSIPQIATFCMQAFNWAPSDLEKNIGNCLWPGVFLRMITLVSRGPGMNHIYLEILLIFI